MSSDIAQALPEAEYEIAGKKWRLFLNLGSLAKIEKMTGKNPFEASLWDSPSPDLILHLLWAAMLRTDPTLTPAQVGDMISLKDLSKVAEVLKLVFTAAMGGTTDPEKKKGKGAAEAPKVNGADQAAQTG